MKALILQTYELRGRCLFSRKLRAGQKQAGRNREGCWHPARDLAACFYAATAATEPKRSGGEVSPARKCAATTADVYAEECKHSKAEASALFYAATAVTEQERSGGEVSPT